MFYNYVKLVYLILEEYSAKSDEFNTMLDINNDLLKNLNKTNKTNKKNKSIKINNNIQLGGNHELLEKLNSLKTEILNGLEKLINREEFDKAKSMLINLIEYVNKINTLINSERMEKLKDQLEDMNNILKQYG